MRTSFCVGCLAAFLLAGSAFAAEEGDPPKRAGGPPPAVISLDFEIIELPAFKDALDTDERLVARAKELQAAGKVRGTTRIRLTTVDGHAASAQFGLREAMPTGRSRTAGGFNQTSFTYQNVGTLVGATPEVVADGGIRVEVQIEQSQISRPKVDPDSKEEPPPAAISNLSTKTSVTVRKGKPAVVAAMTTGSNDETLTIVIVTGHVVN